jgi:hypothetical protein
VIGSDVLGPMGHELVPHDSSEEAREFMQDHKGRRVLRFEEVTPELLKALDEAASRHEAAALPPAPRAAGPAWPWLLAVLALAGTARCCMRCWPATPTAVRRGRPRRLVQSLQLTDLAWFTEARYTRHLSQADLHTPSRTGRRRWSTFRPARWWARCGRHAAAGFAPAVRYAMATWLARQRYLVDFAVAGLRRQRARHLGLLLVYTLLVFVLASVVMLASALRREAAVMLQDTPDVVLQGLRMGRHEMSRAADLERLRGLRGTQPRRAGCGAICTTPPAAPTTRCRCRHPARQPALAGPGRGGRGRGAAAPAGCGRAAVPGVAQRRVPEPEGAGRAAGRPRRWSAATWCCCPRPTSAASSSWPTTSTPTSCCACATPAKWPRWRRRPASRCASTA